MKPLPIGYLSSLRKELRRICFTGAVPVITQLQLTTRCNLRCPDCPLSREPEAGCELTSQEIDRILDELSRMHSLYLFLSGGEILAREDFWDIAHQAKRRGFLLVLATNGSLIGPDELDRIKQISPLRVEINLLSDSPAEHDRRTAVAGSFHRSLAAIRKLRERGVSVLARTPPTDNLPQQGERDERFVPSVSQSLLAFPRREGSQGSPERIVSLPYPLPRPWLIPDESDPPLPHGMPYDLDDVEDVNCIAGKAIVSISSSGDVYPCSPLPIDLGNVRELPFERIWARAGDVTPAERAYAVHACRGCFAAAESLLPCTTWPCRILDDGGDTQFPAAFTRATA